MANGPPWISRINGYRFPGAKAGGLTTHPCTRVPPLELYQISSTGANRLFPSTSSFTLVSRGREIDRLAVRCPGEIAGIAIEALREIAHPRAVESDRVQVGRPVRVLAGIVSRERHGAAVGRDGGVGPEAG